MEIFYTAATLEINSDSGVKVYVRPWSSFGFNGEVSLTYRSGEGVLLQAGYRYQVFELEARAPGRWQETSPCDITHGLTVSGVFLF